MLKNPFVTIKNKFKDFFKSSSGTIARVTNYIRSGYSGSSYGSGDKFTAGMSPSQMIVTHDHFQIRQRVRDMMYDSTIARAMVERKADSVVDTGLRVKPTPNAAILGRTPEEMEIWAEDVADRFHMWAKSKHSHRSRVNNFYQNQRLYSVFQERDNDIFVRLYYTKDKDQLNPLSIDFLETNQIRGYAYTTSYCQYPGDDGIIRDSAGRETGYKIWYYDRITGKYTQKDIPARGEKSGRLFMLHGFNPEYAGQGRGFSRLTHLLQEFELLTDFKISTIKKAITQSALVMAVENDEQDPSNPLENRVAGPRPEYGSATGYSSNTNGLDQDTDPIVNYTAMPEATITEPGTVGIFSMKRGDKLNYLKDTSPSTSFDAFVNSFCSYLVASTGMPIEVMLMKFNANYSASRASLIMFWRVAQIWRDEMASDFLDPVYEMWLTEEIAAGRILAPGFSDPRIKAAWLCAEWSGSPMPSIDPLKAMQASKLAVELGAETLDDTARENNGSSGKANRAKLARQYEELPEPSWGWVPGKQEQKDEQQKESEDE